MNTGIVTVTFTFVAVNYIYCFATKQNIRVAHERSFFQCVLGLYLSIFF